MIYKKLPSNIIAVMSAELDDMPYLDTPDDVKQTALEWLPIATPDYRRLSQLLIDEKVRADPRWSADGKILEISLVRND